jgi:hypothetical protein
VDHMIEDSFTGMKVVLLTQPVRAQLHPIQQGWLPDSADHPKADEPITQFLLPDHIHACCH